MRIPVLLLPNSMSLAVHIFLLLASVPLLLLCASTSCLANQYNNCLSDTVTCEDVEFSYPFGKNGSGCGDPEFQLQSCDNQGHSLINIGGNQYHILGSSLLLFWNGSMDSILTIVNDNLWDDKCNLSGNYSEFWRSDSHFQILDTYINLTLWKPHSCNDRIPDNIHGSQVHKSINLCGDNWHYSLSPHIDLQQTPFCNAFQVPINKDFIDNQTFLEQPFDVSWNVDPNRFQSCRACLNSNGYCGYDISKPTTFLCHCPDGTSNPDKCPDHGTQDTGTGNTSAILLTGCYVVGVGLTAIAVALVVFLTYDFSKRRNPSPPRLHMDSVQMSEGNGNDVANPPSSFNCSSGNETLFTTTEKSSSIEIRF